MAENGEEKLLAVARHIAKTLGHNNHNIADDILQIFSNFDGRFSKEKLSDDGAGNDPMGCAALEQKLNSIDRRILCHVSSDQSIWSNSADSASFLAAVDELVAAVEDWSPLASDKEVGACLLRADEMLQQAMFRAEDEFRSLMELGGDLYDLTRNNGGSTRNDDSPFDSDDDEEEENDGGGNDLIPVAKPVSDYDVVIDSLPPGTVNDLREIAKRMVAAGFGKECSHVYGVCRREFLEESMSRLGLQKLSISEVHKMPWQELEDEIERWMKASKVALKILFPSERRLCDRVFSGLSSSSADLSFMEVCRGSAIQLLNFADAVAIGSRSPERLFRVLDVFETMRDLIPEFELLFSDQYCAFLVNEAVTIWKRLGEAIRGIFMELENLISRDPVKAAVPGGGLHPITRYVMNYLRAACRSRQTLELVFQDNEVSLKDYPQLEDRLQLQLQPNSSFSIQITWIMDILERNLEAKSKIYKDPALCSVFMMNNGRYIVQKAKDSELGTLLGDDWIRKHTGKVRQCHVSYQRSSWNKLLGFLKVENNGSMSMAAKPMKEKLKLFNHHFEEICRVQSQWLVFDEQLREEIRISLEKILLPAYASFIGRFHNVPELGKHADKYVKFGMEDIEARLNDLFQGSSGSNGGRK
ncbi:exocyst complex component EXO70B1-like [Abrus precatorius]|uniref:Exocyst subunit Exo70 family protein n=1 Tax=Abrus precatorius TaxID=3816 RepID=A0A8B8JYU7_ABRPR|nr:exocyst complex component EXO70B1-like [Abrus precatorius]